MNTVSKYLISFLIVVTFMVGSTSAQRSYRFGLDLSKTAISNVFSGGKGLVLEPILIHRKDSCNVGFKMPLGYSWIKRDEIYVNSSLETTGFYLKPGIGYTRGAQFFPYMNLLVSTFEINNTFVLEGEVFGDYVGEYTDADLFALGIEPNIDAEIELAKRLSLIISIRFTFIFLNSANSSLPIYYVPGAGVSRNGKRSGGVNIYLVW